MLVGRPSPARGLLAGLIALVLFASAAVALASRQPVVAANASGGAADAAQTVVVHDDGDGGFRGDGRAGGGRFR